MMTKLTDTERETLDRFPVLPKRADLHAAVEAILTARLAATEAERDSAQEHLAYHLRDFQPGADMKATGDLAVDMAAYATRLKARCDALTPRLARVEALDAHAIAAAIYSGGGAVHPDAADRVLRVVRAALAAPTPTEVQP